MTKDIKLYNERLSTEEARICTFLAEEINRALPEATSKIWHRHPVWFLDDNPVVGYNKLKGGIRLMFWSGESFEEERLVSGTGKFKDAHIYVNSIDMLNLEELTRWLSKARDIQWDYKNVVRRKGKLIRLK
ncbi:DUF1801 domain-containing protein [Sphingobacterium haloxyli]|uniref:YdhG-like domain-containing protein n=1 Tax=Sphingobacterium haloxyli TaxID=2100533 RepID=A0A2S9IVN3_9SPHI|nr:DUF1801 domain-containing protein [Sphingobacterium haloxyli]PRD44584.1 hypothetical protein C5745_19055 [Sphingobacterium haloxyli]